METNLVEDMPSEYCGNYGVRIVGGWRDGSGFC